MDNKPLSEQLDVWTGDFGDAYTERNVLEPGARTAGFSAMLDGIELSTILEVGANRGHNLTELQSIFPSAEVVGIEPNSVARGIARNAGLLALNGVGQNIPFKDGSFDLVLTVGVLIHIADTDLDAILSEIHRASRRYILACEYMSEDDVSIDYRGMSQMLWKRDFGKHYRRLFPDLKLLRAGYLGQDEGFDRITWWLLDKN